MWDEVPYMREHRIEDQSLDQRMATRLRVLRTERDWSLDQLSKRCGVSRATLSRLENAEVSPTAAVLGRLCVAYGLTMSRLLAMVETEFAPLVRRDEQAVWDDPGTGFRRRMVSPPVPGLAGELVECRVPAAKRIEYPNPPVQGLEHHLFMLDGTLEVTVGGARHRLSEGDCLRYRLHGPSVFETGDDQPARYLLALV